MNFFEISGANEGFSLKDTVVKHPYLFVDSRLEVPVGGIRKKAVSSECLVSMADSAAVTEEKPEEGL